MTTIDYTLDRLQHTPRKPTKLVDEPWYNVNFPIVIWVIGQPRCLPLDEYVYTPNGAVEVKDVYDGMSILGGYVSESYVFEDDVYELIIGQNKFRANGEHPIWVAQSKSKDGKRQNGKWLRVIDIFNHYQTKKNNESRWKAFRYNENNFEFNEISVGMKFAKLLGYLMSDGYFSREQSVKFTNINKDLLMDFTELALEVGQEYGFGLKQYEKGNGMDIMLTRHGNFKQGSPLKTKLRELGVIDRDTLGKIVSLKKEELIEFVKGYFNGDGSLDIHYGRPRINFFIGIHEKQAHEFQFILWRLGIKGKVRYELKGNMRAYAGCWKVSIETRKQVEKLLEILDDRKYPEKFREAKECVKRLSKQSDYFESIDGDWPAIYSIKKLGRRKVMGWETKPTHEIICSNGLKTHNSGKGFSIAKMVQWDIENGLTVIWLFSAGGYENLYPAINKDCKKRWAFVMKMLAILVKRENGIASKSEIMYETNFEKNDEKYKKYLQLGIDLGAIRVKDDIIAITDEGQSFLREEPLHCNCEKAQKILVLIPPYQTPVQETVDRFNGWYWGSKEEYFDAWNNGLVDDYIPEQPWIDYTKILKPVKLRPEPMIIFKKITLPMTPAKVEQFRKEFREAFLQCREEGRLLINSPQFYTTDHTGKLEKYTVVAESLRYLPELSQKDCAPLRLDKPSTKWTVKEKSHHKISIVANEVRSLAPSNRLSSEPESSISKRSWFGFLPERRHSKCWVKADMQSADDFFIGARNQGDIWFVKRITTGLLGQGFEWLEKEILEYRFGIFNFYKSNQGEALRRANEKWPLLSEIPDNKGYVVFGNREIKLVELDPVSWHPKSDMGDDFFADTGIEFIKDKARELDEKVASTATTAEKKKKTSKYSEEELLLIKAMRSEVPPKSFDQIIKFFQDKAKAAGDVDSYWFKQTKKNLSNRFNAKTKSTETKEG